MPREHESVLVVDCTEDKGEILVEPLDLEEETGEKAARRMR
jgi:hypothetical protein